MAQKSQSSSLTTWDKRKLKKAANLQSMENPEMRRLGQWMINRWLDTNPTKEDAADKFLQEYQPPEDLPEEQPDAFFDQYQYIKERFYAVTSASSSGDVYYIRQHQKERADDRTSTSAIVDTLNNRFMRAGLDPAILEYVSAIIPPCVAREYQPNNPPLFRQEYAQYANSWVPPRLQPSGAKVEQRPALWQEYLDRLMPKGNLCSVTNTDGESIEMEQQDYLERWLAQRVRFPHIPNTVAVVLRGDFGTGKGYWLDELATVLVGHTNYKSVTTKDWKGDFNADMFQSVIIHLEETRDTRQNTGEMLKKLITQSWHRSNEKQVPQRHVEKHFGVVITSNYQVPITIDKGDRRYFVPVYSKHLHDDGEGMAGKNETARFIERFDAWLKADGGFQVMRDWLETLDMDGTGFRMAPDSPDKTEIWQETRAYDSNEAEIGAWLHSKSDRKLVFSSTAVARYWGISDVDAQTILKKSGYVAKQINLERIGEGNSRFWVPKKHQDTRGWAQKGWEVWHAYAENTMLQNPEEPETPERNGLPF